MERATSQRTLTQADFDRYAVLSGDDNPIHVDPAFAANSRFGRTVSHGMLLYGLLCAHLQRHYPGAVQLSQDLMFPAPTYTDETLTVETAILAREGDILRLSTRITKPGDVVVCEGETRLSLAGMD